MATTTNTHTLRIPGGFWGDHMFRDCTPAESVEVKGRSVVVTLTDEALQDLYTDAVYYSDGLGGDGYDPLASSAQRTVKAIRTQAPDWYANYKRSRVGRFDY